MLRQLTLNLSVPVWRKINLCLAIVWLIIIPIAVWLKWVYSIPFVSAISLYANVASHVAAWRADTPNEDEGENMASKKGEPFGGKKAAPFKKGGGRDKAAPTTAKGTPRKKGSS